MIDYEEIIALSILAISGAILAQTCIMWHEMLYLESLVGLLK